MATGQLILKALKDKNEYDSAVKRMRDILNSKNFDSEELKTLSILIEKYQKDFIKIDTPQPIDLIVFRIEQSGFTQKQIAEKINVSTGYLNRILNKKQKITENIINKISEILEIPLPILLQK